MYCVEHYILSDKTLKLHRVENYMQNYTVYKIIQQFKKLLEVHNSSFFHQLLFKIKMT